MKTGCVCVSDVVSEGSDGNMEPDAGKKSYFNRSVCASSPDALVVKEKQVFPTLKASVHFANKHTACLLMYRTRVRIATEVCCRC